MLSNVRRVTMLPLLLIVATGPALGDDWRNCERISFAPLDFDIPACTRLIDLGALSDDQMITALLARAKAYLFARTYRSDHNVDPKQLTMSASADLDRAIAIIRNGDSKLFGRLRLALSQRASVLLQLEKPEQAAHDFAEVLRTFGGQIVPILHGHALAMKRLGRFKEAIADMDALIRIATDTPNYHNWIFTRGEIFEAAADRSAAIEDFRRTLKFDPKHVAAARALKRLGVDP